MPAPKENKNALGNDGGRPSKYKDEFSEQAYKLCLLGFTDKELATFFEVAESTISEWKVKEVKFSEAVKKGKAIADGDIAESFYKRAKGYEFEEVTFEKIDSKANLEISPSGDIKTNEAYKKKVVTKHLPPDAGAALNWLKNRQKDLWRDKQDLGINFDDMPEQMLDTIISRLTEKAKEL